MFYERAVTTTLALDWVIIDIGMSASGPWYTVFNWGNGSPDYNTEIASYSLDADGEVDNELIPTSVLYASPSQPLIRTGILIDVDANLTPRPPDGTYQFVRIYSPLDGANDPTEVDAIEILP